MKEIVAVNDRRRSKRDRSATEAALVRADDHVAMGWSNFQSVIDWGTVPDWFGAVGSVGSVLFVYVGLRREIRARRADEQRARASHARLVSAVVEKRGSSIVRVVISNESDAPVLDVSVMPKLTWHTIGQPDVAVSGTARFVPRIHGRSSHEVFIDLGAEHRLETADQVAVELTFTDHDGNRWRRDGAGQPQDA
ncbi:hypothetical protein ACQPYA_27980 [Micromonospora sp. CA-263727]|uniref:hypothetical protein n=1 Tax=Micromonospora sp. CA-263727 TaxID=3239967 RepID=UPI003D8DB024